MEKSKHLGSRFEWDVHTAPRLIRNEELICAKYPQGKPGSVFSSRRWCGQYSPEQDDSGEQT